MKLDLKLMEKRIKDLIDDQTHLYCIKSNTVGDRKQLDVSVDRSGGMSLDECSFLHREFFNSEFYADYEDFDVTFGTPGANRKCTFPVDFVLHNDKKFELTKNDGTCVIGHVSITDQEKQVLEITGVVNNAEPKDPIQSYRLQWSDVRKARFHLEF
tara:strand:- start:514 stop:981 length:468 start_codon:yes stop_codon:yes gene_type:complete